MEVGGSMTQTEDPLVPGADAADSRWVLIANSIPHIVWIASPDGRIEYLNQQAYAYVGCSPEASIDAIWPLLLHSADAAMVRRSWLEAVRTEKAFSSEFRLRRADGALRWHCGRSLPVRGADGEIVKWIGTATDIDDHKRSETALKRIGDRLAEAQRLAHVGSWSLDVTTGIRVWSDELYRLLGYEPEDVEPGPALVLDRLHPDDAARVLAAIAALESRVETWKDEFRVVLPDGTVRWLVARTEPVLGDAGEVVRIHGTAQDVTERRHAEEKLRFQAHLLDAVGEAVIATDLTGTVIYWGPGAEELYGWRAEEAQGRNVMEMIPMVQKDFEPAEVVRRLAGVGRWSGLMELARRDGSTFTAEITRTSVLDDEGGLVATIGISSDVSAREKAAAELERAHRTTTEALTVLGTLQAEAPVGFAFVDRDLRFVRLNHELASIIGAPIDEVVGRTVAEVLSTALWEQLGPVYRHVLTTGETVRGHRVTVEPGIGGEVRERTASHYPVRVGDKIIGVGVVVHDITERVRAEGFRSAVMSQVADGVCTLDRDGRLMYMNSAASKMLGWTESELRGKYMHELVGFQNFDGTGVSVVESALLTPDFGSRLERSAGETLTRKDGSVFPVAYSAVPLRIASRVEGVAVVFRDISEPGRSPNVIRVLIVDTDRTTSESFRALLDRHEGVEVVGVATTSASAVASAERLRPDVALVNVELPDSDGLATTAIIKADSPSTKVILMTKTRDDTIAIAGIEAGCAGVLDKSRGWVELVSAVRAAYHGETTISQDELCRVLAQVRSGDTSGRSSHLTDREEDVLACMREGLPNAVVAERLGVSPNTVRNHVQRILYKLNVHSKLEAVVLTSREGLQHEEP